MAYYLPDSWYDDSVEPVTECKDCDDKLSDKEKAAYWLESILDRLYSNPDLNALESDLDELCYLLDVKVRTSDLKITSKQQLQQTIKIPKFISI